VFVQLEDVRGHHLVPADDVGEIRTLDEQRPGKLVTDRLLDRVQFSCRTPQLVHVVEQRRTLRHEEMMTQLVGDSEADSLLVLIARIEDPRPLWIDVGVVPAVRRARVTEGH
jgi:hypothetical protein